LDVNGDEKYKESWVVVLSLGIASPERGFSVNNSLVSKECLAVGEQTLCAEQIGKEAVRLYGSVTSIPITRPLIACSRKAHAEYVLQMEKEKKRASAKDWWATQEGVNEQRTLKCSVKEGSSLQANKGTEKFGNRADSRTRNS
jgi:hypothetical protein